MSTSASEFVANIAGIRAVEDAIRASGQYSESLMTFWNSHPVQGKEFGSRVVRKDYDVYLDKSFDWEAIPVGAALTWLHDDSIPSIGVTFRYDYRNNTAKIVVLGGAEDVKALAAKITGFSDALAHALAKSGGQIASTAKTDMGAADRVGNSPVSYPQPVVNPTSHQQ